eukprot:COSAG01_NODE_19608_length_1000_cov_2.480577_1_plen_251_part_10
MHEKLVSRLFDPPLSISASCCKEIAVLLSPPSAISLCSVCSLLWLLAAAARQLAAITRPTCHVHHRRPTSSSKDPQGAHVRQRCARCCRFAYARALLPPSPIIPLARDHAHSPLINSLRTAGTRLTDILSTYHHRHRAERAAPLVSEQSRSPSNPRDQILSQPATRPPSSPARQDASIDQPVRPGPLRHWRFSFADRHPHPPHRHRRRRHPVIGHLYDISIYDISRSSACSCSPTPRASKRITASVPSSSP